MEFEDSFELDADRDTVMRKFSDVPAVARCIPGLEMTGQDEEGQYLGTMTIAFGPKKLRFSGKVRCDFEPLAYRGTIIGGGINPARSAAVKAHTLFEIEALAPRVADGPPRSRVQISSKAELSGVIAQFANTGGVALGREIMRQFSARLAQDLASSAAMASASPGAAASSALPASSASSASSASAATAGARQPAEALSAWRLLGMVLRAWWRQLLGKR